ncbi:MAG TPA: mechanosensitive ion channel family protein [Caldilineaceae bacterium]|nr:mechanosensitive ion channel family protein [Caldilineaceae bacterium]HRW06965.1 mechanosensitive ion channel family protein [Caldilineaceae bacterium]
MLSQLGNILNGSIWNPNSLLGAIAYFIVFMVIATLIVRTVRVLFTQTLKRDSHGVIDRTTASFLVQAIQIVIYVVAFTLYAHLIPVLNSLGSALLTGVSISAVVVGLAAQSTLSNLVASIALVLYRPFRIGDQIQISAPTGLETGVVNNLTLGYTVLETFDNRHIVVPNSVMANQITVNLTSVNPRAMAIVPIQISYESDVAKARQILIELANAQPSVQEVVGCPLTALGAYAVTLSLRAWCADAGAAKTVEYTLYEQVLTRFTQAGIEMPYPYMNVLLQAGETAESTMST